MSTQSALSQWRFSRFTVTVWVNYMFLLKFFHYPLLGWKFIGICPIVWFISAWNVCLWCHTLDNFNYYTNLLYSLCICLNLILRTDLFMPKRLYSWPFVTDFLHLSVCIHSNLQAQYRISHLLAKHPIQYKLFLLNLGYDDLRSLEIWRVASGVTSITARVPIKRSSFYFLH